MGDAPKRIWACPPDIFDGMGIWHAAPSVPGEAPYILDTPDIPEALAASPEVQKLVAEAEARVNKAHEKEVAVWSENYAAIERERDKWFEGAGAHHVASMQQAQRADRAEAALSAAQQRIQLLCDNDEWNLGLQEALEAICAEAAIRRAEGETT